MQRDSAHSALFITARRYQVLNCCQNVAQGRSSKRCRGRRKTEVDRLGDCTATMFHYKQIALGVETLDLIPPHIRSKPVTVYWMYSPLCAYLVSLSPPPLSEEMNEVINEMTICVRSVCERSCDHSVRW